MSPSSRSMAIGENATRHAFSELRRDSKLLALGPPDRMLMWSILKMSIEAGAPAGELLAHDFYESCLLAERIGKQADMLATQLEELWRRPSAEPFQAMLPNHSPLNQILRNLSAALLNGVATIGAPSRSPATMQTWMYVMATELAKERLGSYCEGDVAELAQILNPTLEDVSAEVVKKRLQRFRKQFPEMHAELRSRAIRPADLE